MPADPAFVRDAKDALFGLQRSGKTVALVGNRFLLVSAALNKAHSKAGVVTQVTVCSPCNSLSISSVTAYNKKFSGAIKITNNCSLQTGFTKNTITPYQEKVPLRNLETYAFFDWLVYSVDDYNSTDLTFLGYMCNSNSFAFNGITPIPEIYFKFKNNTLSVTNNKQSCQPLDTSAAKYIVFVILYIDYTVNSSPDSSVYCPSVSEIYKIGDNGNSLITINDVNIA